MFLSLTSKRVPTTSFLPCVVTPDSFQTSPFSAKICHYFRSLPNINLFHISFLAKSVILYPQIHVFESSKYGRYQRVYTNLNYFLLLTYSCLQNSWSYQLLIIVHLKGGSFCSLAVEVLPCSGCFITCMGAHFPAVELDNAIQFSTLSRMSVFLWHSSKWARRFGRFLQCTSGLEVLACSLNTNLNDVITMHQLHSSLNH